MRLKDYFAGQALRLHSPKSAGTVALRINEGAGSALWPFNTGVIGGVRFGLVRLRYRSSLFEYNAKPILAGRLRDAPGGTILDLRYRAPVWIYAFYVFWYLFLAFAAVGLLANGWGPEVSGGDKVMALATFAVLLGAPLAIHALGTRRSEEELANLLDFLSRHADAKG